MAQPGQTLETGPKPGALPSLGVHEAFAEWAARTPAATALRHTNGALTYQELDLRSNQFANQLIDEGLVPGGRLALVVDRSPEAIIALLGALKAGCAYAPLEPSYPANQIEFMLDDLAPALAVAHRHHHRRLQDARTRVLEDLLRESERKPTSLPSIAADPGLPACIMYTSGSTGFPKGAIVPHRAIVRLVSHQNYASFAQSEVFLHLAPLAFDASTFEIWGALLNGAELAIATPAQPSIEDVASALKTFRPTTAWFTSGLFNLLVDHALEDLAPLSQILTGGDILSPVHVQRAVAAHPNCTFINGYGPTENTTFTCCHRISANDLNGAALPIGTPIANTYVRVLDEGGKIVKTGEIGQLAAGGAGLADGYLNGPSLTAAKFVHDPSCLGERLYLTGDLVRQRSDGVFEFFGRIDTQVKIDGKRVELAEIERALHSYPGIADAAVIATAEPAKRLVAYIAPASTAGVALQTREILAHLRALLPQHMIPSLVIALNQLPLTHNGKLDRAALAPPSSSPSRLIESSTIDQVVRDALQQAFGRELTDDHANFFDLGVTSLKIMSAHALLSERLGRRIPMTALFEHASVGHLLKYLNGAESDSLASARSRGARQGDAIARAARLGKK